MALFLARDHRPGGASSSTNTADPIDGVTGQPMAEWTTSQDLVVQLWEQALRHIPRFRARQQLVSQQRAMKRAPTVFRRFTTDGAVELPERVLELLRSERPSLIDADALGLQVATWLIHLYAERAVAASMMGDEAAAAAALRKIRALGGSATKSVGGRTGVDGDDDEAALLYRSQMQLWFTAASALCAASFFQRTLGGRTPRGQAARNAELRGVLQACLDMLEDADDTNDDQARLMLAAVFTVCEDEVNVNTAVKTMFATFRKMQAAYEDKVMEAQDAEPRQEVEENEKKCEAEQEAKQVGDGEDEKDDASGNGSEKSEPIETVTGDESSKDATNSGPTDKTKQSESAVSKVVIDLTVQEGEETAVKSANAAADVKDAEVTDSKRPSSDPASNRVPQQPSSPPTLAIQTGDASSAPSLSVNATLDEDELRGKGTASTDANTQESDNEEATEEEVAVEPQPDEEDTPIAEPDPPCYCDNCSRPLNEFHHMASCIDCAGRMQFCPDCADEVNPGCAPADPSPPAPVKSPKTVTETENEKGEKADGAEEGTQGAGVPVITAAVELEKMGTGEKLPEEEIPKADMPKKPKMGRPRGTCRPGHRYIWIARLTDEEVASLGKGEVFRKVPVENGEKPKLEAENGTGLDASTSGKGSDERFMTMEEWKAEIRAKYMGVVRS